MTRFTVFLLALFVLGSSARAASDKVTIRNGETWYAHFQQKGKKLKFLDASKEKDPHAQLVISLSSKDKEGLATLKLESALDNDLVYRATMWSNLLKRHATLTVYPIVGGKMGTVQVPPLVDEIVLFDFRYEPATLIEKEKDEP
ncbi:MAG TPA: hypothetical protein VG936_15255 [Lacunisphaera sp.]|nr:hypothetical protein [Lacunisphaera sp.]